MYLIGLKRGLGTLRVEKEDLPFDNKPCRRVLYSVM